MNSKVWLINTVLLGMVIFLGARVYSIRTHGVPEPGEAAKVKAATGTGVPALETAERKTLLPERTYNVLVTKDLFVPERRAPEEKTVVKTADRKTVPVFSKKIYLYGVVLMEGRRMALVSKPEGIPGKKREVWVGVGDSVGDFTVSQIEKEKIVLEENKETYDVLLFDKNKPRRRVIVRKTTKLKAFTAAGLVEKLKSKIAKPQKPRVSEIRTTTSPLRRPIRSKE